MSSTEKTTLLFTTQLSEKEQENLKNDGFSIDIVPFITFEYMLPIMWMDQLPEKTDAWVFTSKKAVKAVKPAISNLEPPEHIFAIGSKTGKKLEKLNFDVTVPEEYNLVSLAKKMKKLSLKHVVHFCGNLKAGDLNALLGEQTTVTSIEVYNTKRTPRSLDTSNYQGIVFMSPSAVKTFSEQNKINDKTQVFCIGSTTEAAANAAGFNNCIMPEHSTLDCLGQSIQTYFN